jgi:hypothetical protein
MHFYYAAERHQAAMKAKPFANNGFIRSPAFQAVAACPDIAGQEGLMQLLEGWVLPGPAPTFREFFR